MQNVQNKNSFFPAFQCLSVSWLLVSKPTVQRAVAYLLSNDKNYAFSQIPITLQKEVTIDHEGKEVARCGFKIGGRFGLAVMNF